MSAGNKLIRATTVKMGIYEQSTDEQLGGCLGQIKSFEDGRKFRLCFANGNLTAGLLVQAPAPNAYDDALVVNTAAVAGDREIEVTVTAGHGGYDKDALKDGFLTVCQGTGIGCFYKIEGNDAMVASATATIFLYSPLTTALVVSDNEVSVCLNPYKDVVTCSTTAPIIGVPIIAVTDNYYFWAQFKGIGPGTDDGGTAAAGDNVISKDNGTLDVQTDIVNGTIGMAITAAAANDAYLVRYTGL